MKTFQILLIMIIAAMAFCAQFEIVKDVTELPGDLTAQRYGFKDVNGQWCAILKVHSDVKGIKFEGMGYEKSDYRDGGIYLVYLQPDSKNFKLIKDGYIPMVHAFPLKLKSNTVYMMEIKGVGEEKKIEDIAITVISEPKGASVYLDGVNKGSSEQINAAVGRHELKLEKTGYETKNEIIEVTPGKTLFKYNLEKVIEAIVEIYSEPSGAKVYIDDKQYGTTPVSDFFPPGNYSIRLTYDNFDDVIENIQIKSPETKKTYKMADIRATLTINTHEKAKVFINGEQVTNYKDIKLAPQVATVKVEMNKAKTIEERVMLGKKEIKTIEMFPQIATGTVQVAVIPTDALIELTEDGGEKFTNTGSKVFSDVPAGDYTVKATKNGYISKALKINLLEGTNEKVNFKLDEGLDTSGDYIFVKGGTFMMGSDENDYSRPVHKVTVGDFMIGKYEVNSNQWMALMETYEQSVLKGEAGENYPVIYISWGDAVDFCNKLSEVEGLEKCYEYKTKEALLGGIEKIKYKCNFKANGYRLPTEAEWEYASRGGNLSKGYKFSGSDDLNEVGWYFDNSGSVHPVGKKNPNELGIYDMSGNVWELCWDWHDSKYYKKSPKENPSGPTSGDYRVIRGGSAIGGDELSRSAYRYNCFQEGKSSDRGFRLVRNAE